MASGTIQRSKTSFRATYHVPCTTYSSSAGVYYGSIRLNDQDDFPTGVSSNSIDIFPLGARANGKSYPATCQISVASGTWVLRVSNAESSEDVIVLVMYYY